MNLRNLAIWGVIIVALVAVFTVMNGGARGGNPGPMSYSQLLRKVDNGEDRKSTRLNSSHVAISYAVFCLKKKNAHKPHAHAKSTWSRAPRQSASQSIGAQK